TVGRLSQIVRQKKDSPILRLATQVRKLANQTYFPTRLVLLPARDFPEIEKFSHQKLLMRYRNHLKQYGFEEVIAICHSNFACQKINAYIRKHRFGKAHLELQVDDILMVTQNNYLVPLVNGDFVKVKNIGDRRMQGGFHFVELRVEAKHNKKNYKTLLCLDALHSKRGNLEQDQQRSLMIDFARRIREKGIRRQSQAYKKALREDPYLNSLRAGYGYAVTCHKSQGGEWDHVFFFLQNGMYVMHPQHLLRWWYTGITRAKKKLYLVDDWWIG